MIVPPDASSAPSFFVIETGVTLIAVALAFCWPRTGSSRFLRVERLLTRLARRRRWAVVSAGVIPLVLRLLALPLFPAPQPFVHDEFSFLLAADTFASGRVTNPTPPLWRHFESFHITQKPTYMSMYFPAQGLVLAAGQKFFGNPWLGVCLSAALLCSALCWMLQGWLPPGWALLGAELGALRLALFSYWGNSYYGGAVAAVGGLLLLGALPRILRRARARDFFVLAAGVTLLANSRPYEGLVLCLPVLYTLIAWLPGRRSLRFSVLLRRALLAVILLMGTAGGMAYYNQRVFGSPFLLPYQVNRAAYASAPVFLWETPRPEPVYRHAVMREFYSKWELGDFLYARSVSGFLSRTLQKLGIAVFFFYGVVLFVPLLMLPAVLRDRRVRFLLVASGVSALGLCCNAWLFPHYLAPLTGAVYVILLQAMRHMRQWRPHGQPFGLALVRVLPLLCLLLAGLRLFALPLGLRVDRWPTMWYGTPPLGMARAQTLEQLRHYHGKQLAIVRYSPGHSVFDDWVYNEADIRQARVVWAREMSAAENLDLLRSFRDRQVWLVEPDAAPPRISLYTPR